MILYFVCKVIRCFFNICCSFFLCNTCHILYIPQSLDMTSYHFSRHLSGANLTISFAYIFSRGFNKGSPRNSPVIFALSNKYAKDTFNVLFMETMMLSWKFLRSINLVRAPMFLVKHVNIYGTCTCIYYRITLTIDIS